MPRRADTHQEIKIAKKRRIELVQAIGIRVGGYDSKMLPPCRDKQSATDVRISKALRRYKVGYVSIQHSNRRPHMTTHYCRSPSLHLKGDWLAEAGFGTDTPVTITVERGQLVIRPAE